MTAINVLLLAGEVHVFADGGHFTGKVLRGIAPKVYPLPKFNAALAWSGPTFDAEKVMALIGALPAADLKHLIALLPAAIGAFGWSHRFSAILVGVHQGRSTGIAVEEGGRAHHLGPGSVIKSLSSLVPFVPANLRANAVEMMEDQRARHGVVAGFVQYVAIRPSGIETTILKQWPDLVAGGGGITHAAKIGDLEVDTINIALDAFSGNTSSSTSIIVPNEEALIVSLFASVTIYATGRVNTNTVFSWVIERTRDAKAILSGAIAVSINPPPGYAADTAFNSSGTAMDESAGADEEYEFQFSPSASSGTFFGSAGGTWHRTSLVTALYRKR